MKDSPDALECATAQRYAHGVIAAWPDITEDELISELQHPRLGFSPEAVLYAIVFADHDWPAPVA